ncbi:hypothetical protein [Paraburkholderia tropica]|uniref:hypothetical protein n=1 Tax=Paraburkholderia tropica TaxID=92647 RepID=UPI003D2D4C29
MNGLESTHVANPVRVRAQEIVNILDRDLVVAGGVCLKAIVLDPQGEPTEVVFDPGMIARYEPVSGDYLVTQEDGYQYINPKAVFERKYRAIGDDAAEAPRDIFAAARRELRQHFLTRLIDRGDSGNLCKRADEFVEYVVTGKLPSRV